MYNNRGILNEKKWRGIIGTPRVRSPTQIYKEKRSAIIVATESLMELTYHQHRLATWRHHGHSRSPLHTRIYDNKRTHNIIVTVSSAAAPTIPPLQSVFIIVFEERILVKIYQFLALEEQQGYVQAYLPQSWPRMGANERDPLGNFLIRRFPYGGTGYCRSLSNLYHCTLGVGEPEAMQ